MLEQARIRDLPAVYAGAAMARSHKVTFRKSGITIDVAEDEYILEEAEDAGLPLPYDCRSGTCTTCIQKCLEGEIDQDMAFAIGDEELEQGLRLICIGSPLSDVVLDA
jgi:ferredoxin